MGSDPLSKKFAQPFEEVVSPQDLANALSDKEGVDVDRVYAAMRERYESWGEMSRHDPNAAEHILRIVAPLSKALLDSDATDGAAVRQIHQTPTAQKILTNLTLAAAGSEALAMAKRRGLIETEVAEFYNPGAGRPSPTGSHAPNSPEERKERFRFLLEEVERSIEWLASTGIATQDLSEAITIYRDEVADYHSTGELGPKAFQRRLFTCPKPGNRGGYKVAPFAWADASDQADWTFGRDNTPFKHTNFLIEVMVQRLGVVLNSRTIKDLHETTMSLFQGIRDIGAARRLRGGFEMVTFGNWVDRHGKDLSQFCHRQVEIHLNPVVAYYHMIHAAHRVADGVNTLRDPLDLEALELTEKELLAQLNSPLAEAKHRRANLATIFKAAREILKPYFKTHEAIPTEIADTPPRVEIIPEETPPEKPTRPLLGLEELALIAKEHFKPKGSKKQARQVQRERQRTIRFALSECKARASHTPGMISGYVQVARRTTRPVQALFLHRDTDTITPHPSNLPCRGDLFLNLAKEIVLIPIEMDASGEISVLIEGKRHGARAANSIGLQNFYEEIQELMALGLRDLLTRDESPQAIRKSVPLDRPRNDPPTTEEPSSPIRHQLTKDFIVHDEARDNPSAENSSQKVKRVAKQIQTLLKKPGRLEKEDLESIDWNLYREEPLLDEEGTDTGETIFIPVDDLEKTLQELKDQSSPPETLFICQTPGYIRGAGYYPYRKKEDPKILYLSQKKASRISELRRRCIEQRLGVDLIRDIPNKFMLEVDVDSTRSVMIDIRDEADALSRRLAFVPEEVLLMKQAQAAGTSLDLTAGFSTGSHLIDQRHSLWEEDLPPLDRAAEEGGITQQKIRHRIAAVLTLPQRPLYNQGTFVRLDMALSHFPEEGPSLAA